MYARVCTCAPTEHDIDVIDMCKKFFNTYIACICNVWVGILFNGSMKIHVDDQWQTNLHYTYFIEISE